MNKKSKLPDLNELASFAGKLFKDVKKSVGEIMSEYQKNHAEHTTKKAPAEKSQKQKKESVKKTASVKKTTDTMK